MPDPCDLNPHLPEYIGSPCWTRSRTSQPQNTPLGISTSNGPGTQSLFSETFAFSRPADRRSVAARRVDCVLLEPAECLSFKLNFTVRVVVRQSSRDN